MVLALERVGWECHPAAWVVPVEAVPVHLYPVDVERSQTLEHLCPVTPPFPQRRQPKTMVPAHTGSPPSRVVSNSGPAPKVLATLLPKRLDGGCKPHRRSHMVSPVTRRLHLARLDQLCRHVRDTDRGGEEYVALEAPVRTRAASAPSATSGRRGRPSAAGCGPLAFELGEDGRTASSAPDITTF